MPSPNSACNSKTQVTQHPELTQTGMMLAGNCMRISVRPLDRRPSRHQRAARNTQDHSTATKLAQQPAFSGSPRKSSPSTPKNADFGPFWVRRANFFALTPTPSRAGRTFSRTRHSTMATLKPTTPLRPKNAPKTPVSHPRRRHRFQPHAGTSSQRRQGFQRTEPPGLRGLAAAPTCIYASSFRKLARNSMTRNFNNTEKR